MCSTGCVSPDVTSTNGSKAAPTSTCGDAQRMAPDVHEALVDVVSTHGGKSREDAHAWLESLREQRRYLRDVY